MSAGFGQRIIASGTPALAIFLVATCEQAEQTDHSPTTTPSASANSKSVGDDLPLSPLEDLSNSRFEQEIASELERLAPEKDGSRTEQFNEAANAQLKKLAALLADPTQLGAAALKPLLAESFRSTPLDGGASAATSRDAGGLLLRRGASRAAGPASSFPFKGAAGFLETLKASIQDSSGLETHFKITNVFPLAHHEFGTRILVQSLLETGQDRRQHNASWAAKWSWPKPSKPPVLVDLDVIDFEEIATAPGQQTGFQDCTNSVFEENGVARKQIVRGVDHWRERIDWRFGIELIGPHGLAVGDVNGDGLDDVYLCAPGGLPNRLLIQQPDGTVRDEAQQWGVDLIDSSASALIIDLDNDDDQDLAFTTGRYLLIYENDGETFIQRTILKSNSMGRSICAADYDLDGDLDIYVCGYYSRTGDSIGIGRPVPYHDANNGTDNYLIENRGKWKFADVTKQVGLDQNNMRFSYAAAWEDYDDDGDVDLYVANDFGRNNLYRNDRSDQDIKFTDIAFEAGVEDISAGMSVSWGDYDGDGASDLYIGNMFSSAGNRVAYQRDFRSGSSGEIRAQYRRHARGNTLFRNAGNGTFQDATIGARVNMGRWAWSSLFADLNNDGWEDLLVANGMVTGPTDPADL